MLSPGERFRDQRLASLLHLAGTEFRVLKVLQGGMASVAMVEGENGRVCALKFLDLRSADSDTIERFRREVQVWVTAASCDAVVQVLGTLRIDEAPVVCAEWMSGGDLSRVMNSGDPRVFYSVIDRIAAGLEWVHEKYKVIHRDLKPSNILLNNKGDAFISDWGIGKVALEAEKLKARIHPSEKRTSIVQAPLTETGQVVGTITYCSPEQILSSSEVDFRSDIYSLGCLMFEWEVGTPPFVDVSWEEIARKHLESAPPKIAGAFRKSKFGADSVIQGCLQKSPDQRFGSYKDLRNALRSQAARKGITYPLAQVGGRNMPLVGYGEILGLKPKVVGTKGWCLIEYEAAEGYVEVLELFELQLLLSKLFVRERTLALLDAATGLRVSELLALRWSDVDFENLELNVTRSIWHQVVGNCKTEASAKPVPMDSYMAEDLLRWRRQSDYRSDDDFVFASETMKGKQPYWPDNLMKRHIRPVARANGINKNIGWHTFRHSFGTLLKANGEDVKTVQELLRHANGRITLDVYTQAVSSNKRAAQSKVVKMMVPNLGEMEDKKLSQNGR